MFINKFTIRPVELAPLVLPIENRPLNQQRRPVRLEVDRREERKEHAEHAYDEKPNEHERPARLHRVELLVVHRIGVAQLEQREAGDKGARVGVELRVHRPPQRVRKVHAEQKNHEAEHEHKRHALARLHARSPAQLTFSITP